MKKSTLLIICATLLSSPLAQTIGSLIGQVRLLSPQDKPGPRETILLDSGWKFLRYNGKPDSLIYDKRPEINFYRDNIDADTRATQEGRLSRSEGALKAWILPTANHFIKDPAQRHIRPKGNPGEQFPFVQAEYDDSSWSDVRLPHDWAIEEPFYEGDQPEVGGGMGRLPSHGVAWYRKKIEIPETDRGRQIYLNVEGAMSYAMVWVNGKLAGGWPYGYNSFRIDLTPYLNFGSLNQIAVRLDNPNHSSRWYTGGGLYRNVWLVKCAPAHVAQWGTAITSLMEGSTAHLHLQVEIENHSGTARQVQVVTEIYHQDSQGKPTGEKSAVFPEQTISLAPHATQSASVTTRLTDPKRWGPPPAQAPHMYLAVTRVYENEKEIDRHETPFGIRDIRFHPDSGVIVNGEPIRLQGVNQHHDLGALGTAFNRKAALRQLEMLREMGCNAIRLAHNPPAPELLDLADRLGFLVIDELYDCWEKGKTPLDAHLIFPDWHEADTRALVRRDQNHPSVIVWSIGNEVGEQYTGEEGARWANRLKKIVKEEDASRPTTASMNFAKPGSPFAEATELISLNYQGEGIRDAEAYRHLQGIRATPQYSDFHQQYPDRMIFSSETASALSSRGTYLFPVYEGNSAPVEEGLGGDGKSRHVSAYELYTAPFGSSPDKVFTSQDDQPYIAGEFVWSGWDYLGEPTPYYSARSSYSGIIDLAGFKKDRFYLYKSRWRPDYPMIHILPHWNWPDRVGKITPVHLFTSGDEAELFLNGRSLGRKKKGKNDYRLRWDEVIYEPGELKAVAYKNGKKWAEAKRVTTGPAVQLLLEADCDTLKADNNDLAFITVTVADKQGNTVPDADIPVLFQITGPGEIVATDNGNPADMTPFPSRHREAFSGKALAIVRAKKGATGSITIQAKSENLATAEITVNLKGE